MRSALYAIARPSVIQVYRTKTVEVGIMKFSSYKKKQQEQQQQQ